MDIKEKITVPALNDVWMDNGIETLYCILKSEEEETDAFNVKLDNDSLTVTIVDFDKFKESIATAVKNRRSNLIVTEKDKKSELGEQKEVKKDYVLIQEGAKLKGKVAFKEELYNEKTTFDTIKTIFDLSVKKGSRTCVMCERSFSKPMKKLQQAAYPFVTKIKSLSGVRSYRDGRGYSLKEYFEDFCPICYLTGISEWLDDAMIYRTIPGTNSILFLPKFNNLNDLAKFKAAYRDLLANSNRYCNITAGSEKNKSPPAQFSTLLCFYEKFFFKADRTDAVGKTWAMIEIPFGAVKNVKYDILNLDESILRVIKILSNEGTSVYKDAIARILFFNDNSKGAPVDWDLTNQIIETLSKSLLKDDFRTFAKAILPRKGGHVGISKDAQQNLHKLIYEWRLKTVGMDEKNLETIKSAARTIAAACKDHRGLLYTLDKAKDKSALLDALRQVSRRIAGLKPEEKKKFGNFIYPPALEEIVALLNSHESDKKAIDDIKNILIIFSCVEFSRLDYIDGKKGETHGNE